MPNGSLPRYAWALFRSVAGITKQLRKQEPREPRTSVVSLRYHIKVISLHKCYSSIRELDITYGCVLLIHTTQASCKGNKGGIFGIADQVKSHRKKANNFPVKSETHTLPPPKSPFILLKTPLLIPRKRQKNNDLNA